MTGQADPKRYPISLQEVERARGAVYSFLSPTPLIRYQGLSELLGADVHIKHENHNPTGSFKIRGGINLMSHLRAAGVEGVITFSTGNHGISVATAAAHFGIEATVVVPEQNNPLKNRLIREAGARLIEAGGTFEQASERVESLCRERSLYYVHPADEPHLINGVGTEFLEIAQQCPELDTLILPIGAGSELAAAVITLKQLRPEISLIAVQAQASCAAYRSWQAGRVLSADNRTFAGGFATGTAYQTPFEIYKDALDDFVLLSEEELYQGIALAYHFTRNLVEAAGGATLMAAIRLGERLAGRRLVLQFSGCNATPDEISEAYRRRAFRSGP